MAKETFCIDLDNIAELRELRHMLDEKIAALDSASIEQGMRKIRDSIGFEAANKLFDAIEDCDMVDCTMDEFTKDYDGDVKAALKDSFPAVFEAIPKGAKIYDSVATLVGVMDTDWENNPAAGIEWNSPLKEPRWRVEPVRNDPTEIPGWTEAQDKFNACEGDCTCGVEYKSVDGHPIRYGYAKINGVIYYFDIGVNGNTLGSSLLERQSDGRFARPKKINETMLNEHKGLDAKAFFEEGIPEDIKKHIRSEFAENEVAARPDKVVEITDAGWEKDKDSGIMYTAPEPKDDDPILIEGWAEAKNQFNACKDDCMLRVDV